MIGALVGTARSAKLVMTGSGVGYVVHCPSPLVPGSEVDLLVTTVVREDAITLFGFSNAEEQMLFEALTKVTGVGASIAMSVLADVGVGPAVQAIVAKDAKTLAKAKGLGVKRAETICSMVALPDVLVARASGETASPAAVSLATALMNMGYDETVSLEAARTGLAASDDLATALRVALAAVRQQGEGVR